jgi:hypothetical protein
VYTGFLWGKLAERDHLENPTVDGRIILRWLTRKWDVGVWTVTQDMWHAFVDAAVNHRVP